MHFKEFVLKTQATNLRDSVMQFDSRLTQLQYAIPYRVTSRYINKDQKALDWGCGNGHFSYFLTSQGIQTIGYSFDEKPTFLNNQPLFTFIKGFKNNPIILPFDDESFDFVFSVGVLEHVYETGGNESQRDRKSVV